MCLKLSRRMGAAEVRGAVRVASVGLQRLVEVHRASQPLAAAYTALTFHVVPLMRSAVSMDSSAMPLTDFTFGFAAARAGAADDKALMCKVRGGSATAGYQMTVYPNGRSDEGGTENALLFLPDVALDADLPVGTWIIGHRSAMSSTGGSET